MSEVGAVIFGAGICYLARLVPQFFAASGAVVAAWVHAEGPQEQQKGHLGLQSRTFIDFG